VLALGQEDFAEQLSAGLNELCHVDHVGLFAFDQNFVPNFVSGFSATRTGVTDQANAQYQAGKFFRSDPNLPMLRSQGVDGAEEEEVLLTRQRAEDIADDKYRSEIYERFDLAERVSLLARREGRWFAANVYRDTPVGSFPDSEIEALRARAGLISALVFKHFEIAPPAVWSEGALPSVSRLEARIGQLEPASGAKLSEREIQVCARAVVGYSGEGIALDLGVKQSTVATLRKRAYAKLNISTVHELFMMCLSLEPGS